MTKKQTHVTGAVTAAHDFERVTYLGEMLFSVREGVPLHDAFDKLTSLITASRDNLCTLADHPEVANVTGALWASIHLLSIYEELVQSMHSGHNIQRRGGL